MKHIYFQNGETLVLRGKGIEYLVCCDCGLVHLLFYEKIKDGVKLIFYRDDYQTDKIRRKTKKRKTQ